MKKKTEELLKEILELLKEIKKEIIPMPDGPGYYPETNGFT